MKPSRLLPLLTVLISASLFAADAPVTIENFFRAETDRYFSGYAAKGSFGKLSHSRVMADIDHQDVVRMNRDTVYSSGVFNRPRPRSP